MAGVVWLTCLLLCAWLFPVDAQECATITTPKISVDSRRNRTGHWISQVGFQYTTPSGPESSDGNHWRTEVESRVSRCAESGSRMDVTITLTALPLLAGPGYELFPAVGYYKFHTRPELWPRAREVCAEEGAHLAIVNSEMEADVLKKMFARHPKLPGAGHNDWAWIGEYEGTQPGQYFTIFGDRVNDTGFSRWGPDQPNVVGTQAYLLVHRQTGGLGDTLRNVKDAFFCEQELF